MKLTNAILLCGFLALAGCDSGGGSGRGSGMAPDFTLKDLEGKEVSLSSHRGKAVLLNFWAANCPPCRREIPSLVRLYDRHRDSGFIILGVNAWDESADQIRKFAKNMGMRYPILLKGGKVLRKYGINAIPANFFIDPRGRTAAIEIGFMDEGDMESKIKEILPEESG